MSTTFSIHRKQEIDFIAMLNKGLETRIQNIRNMRLKRWAQPFQYTENKKLISLQC